VKKTKTTLEEMVSNEVFSRELRDITENSDTEDCTSGLLDPRDEALAKVKKLEAFAESLKCCGNCKHFYVDKDDVEMEDGCCYIEETRPKEYVPELLEVGIFKEKTVEYRRSIRDKCNNGKWALHSKSKKDNVK
jgi:hypothetical protein